MRSKRNACGVCTVRRLSRGGVATMRPSRIDLLDRIGQAQARARRRHARARPRGARDQRRARKGPRAIVDQNDLRRRACCGQGFESVADADLPRLAAECRREQAGARSSRRCADCALCKTPRRRGGWPRARGPRARARSSAKSVCVNKGLPASGRYCFGIPPSRPRAASRRHDQKLRDRIVSFMLQRSGFQRGRTGRFLSLFAVPRQCGQNLGLTPKSLLPRCTNVYNGI